MDLNFNYALENLGISSAVELVYSLVGPAGEDTSAFGGNFAVADGGAAVSGSVSESSNSFGAGDYVFSLEANIPLISLRNTQSASVNVSDFSLAFNSVPEPSMTLSLGLGLVFLLGRRSRQGSQQ